MRHMSTITTVTSLLKTRVYAALFLLLGAFLGWFLFGANLALPGTASIAANFPFKLGLDLKGGTHLVYKADTSDIVGNVDESLAALRDTIERRVNAFGISEPLVQTETASSLVSNGENRLIVELPGITDTQKAVEMIGKTPTLDFQLTKPVTIKVKNDKGVEVPQQMTTYVPTGLTGRFIKSATLEFGSGAASALASAQVGVKFDAEGSKLFAKITKENIGKPLAIFLDGQVISAPTIQSEIPNGEAVITGNFTPNEARELVRNLNLGALPVPVTLESTNTVGSTLGADAVAKGINAFFWGFALIALFFVLWYRLPGVVAIVSLVLYSLIMLALFKLIPITLTAAGIAGLILSLGMAVDANVLIFERMKEELRAGKSTRDAINEGGRRAWGAIRDGNLTSLISCAVLFWFGTALVKGFAVVFALGIITSLFTGILGTRIMLTALGNREYTGWVKKLYGVGMSGK
jgi:preprotein translocase subunit SecD